MAGYKINQLPRASGVASSDLFPKDNPGGTSTEAVAAEQLREYILNDVMSDIEEKGEKVCESIEEKGEEVLDSIPEDYTELLEDLADLKSAIEYTASALIGSVAGNPAAIPDAAAGREYSALTAEIDFVQTGTGDPSPSNVRAISGFTAAKVTQCGKNLFDLSAAQGGYIDADGAPHRTADAVTNWTISDYMPVNPGAVMYVLAQTYAAAARHAFYDAGLSCVGVATVDGSSLTVPAGARWVRCSIRKANEETFTRSRTRRRGMTRRFLTSLSPPKQARSTAGCWI